MHLVTCRNKDCPAVAVIDADDVDVHDALDAAGCVCCPEDHHHGRAANAGTPCRPVTITMAPGSADVTRAGA